MKEDFQNFNINGNLFSAKGCADGILIDPKLPKNFDNLDNKNRPVSHQKFWNMPYIETFTIDALDAYYINATDDYAEERRAT